MQPTLSVCKYCPSYEEHQDPESIYMYCNLHIAPSEQTLMGYQYRAAQPHIYEHVPQNFKEFHIPTECPMLKEHETC